MSALTLSAAVASLKPGLSTPPEIALNSWTVLKGVSDSLFPLIKTNHVLAAITTGLIVTSLFATLIRARLPTIQTQQRELTNRSIVVDTLKSVTSAFFLISLTYLSVDRDFVFKLQRQYFQRLSEAVDLLQPGMAIPYDTALVNWRNIKFFAEKIPENLALMQSAYMWMGITVAIATIAVQFIRSQSLEAQPEQYSKAKLWLDRITVGSLGLATVVSLCSYTYARTYYPQLA
jgi:hypothetical protein